MRIFFSNFSHHVGGYINTCHPHIREAPEYGLKLQPRADTDIEQIFCAFWQKVRDNTLAFGSVFYH